MWIKREGHQEPGGARLSSEQKGHLVLERLKGKRKAEMFGKVSVLGWAPP